MKDEAFRLVMVAVRRYSRDPGSRAQSARLLMTSAIALYASETSVAEVAVASAEAVATLTQIERQRLREGRG
jgi:hypothetical protein